MPETNATNVDQIRDLIFGAQIKEFDEKFNQFNTTLHTLESRLNKTFSESHLKLKKETERSFEVLEKKIDNLSTSSHKERSKLKELIARAEEGFQEQQSNQRDEFATKMKMLKENVSDDTKKISKDIETMKIEIETALRSGLSTLSEDKLSRDSMAQMLLNVAMQIQGNDIGSILPEEQKPAK